MQDPMARLYVSKMEWLPNKYPQSCEGKFKSEFIFNFIHIIFLLLCIVTNCKSFDHKNYGDWELRGPCRENLHYLWKRAVRIKWKPHNYMTCNYHGVSLQFLQPFSIDSADFLFRDPAISSPRSFYEKLGPAGLNSRIRGVFS